MYYIGILHELKKMWQINLSPKKKLLGPLYYMGVFSLWKIANHYELNMNFLVCWLPDDLNFEKLLTSICDGRKVWFFM